MKRISTLALLTVAAFLAVPAANAQGTLKAKIPFAFTVANTPLSAGEYTISAPVSGVVRLVNAETHEAAAIGISKGFHEPNGKSALVFDKYGTQYFLHRILCPTTANLNVDVPLSRLEKRARFGEGILVAAR